MDSEIIFDFVTPSNDEGNAGEETTYSYNLLRIGDLDQPVAVNWQVPVQSDRWHDRPGPGQRHRHHRDVPPPVVVATAS